MAAIELSTPQGAEMVLGMIYASDAPWAPEVGQYVRYISHHHCYYYYYYSIIFAGNFVFFLSSI